jgi:hypothetical protein
MGSVLFKLYRVLAIVMLLVLFILIQACSIGYRPSRGRLSDAMEKASDNNKGSRKTEVPDDENNDHLSVIFYPFKEDVVEEGPSDGNGDARTSESPMHDPENGKNEIYPIGGSGGVGLLKSDDFSEMIYTDVSFGWLENDSWLELYIGAAWAGVDHASELDASLDSGITLFNFGFDYKKKISANPKWDTPYFLFGAAYQWMSWGYENAITTADGDTIKDDSLDGLEIHAGFGKNLTKTNGSNFGIEVIPAVIFWSPQTKEGFENDVFDPFFMLKIQAVFSSW